MVIKDWNPKRLFVVTAIALGIIVPIFYFLTKPSLSERLTEAPGTWCIEEIKINDVDVVPVTYGISIQWKDESNCLGNLHFRDNVVTFPGLNSYSGNARWSADEELMEITLASPDAKVFEGMYKIELNGLVLTMESDSVYIRAHQIRWNLPL